MTNCTTHNSNAAAELCDYKQSNRKGHISNVTYDADSQAAFLFVYRLSAQNLMFLSTHNVILNNFWSLSRQLIALILIIMTKLATNKTNTQTTIDKN